MKLKSLDINTVGDVFRAPNAVKGVDLFNIKLAAKKAFPNEQVNFHSTWKTNSHSWFDKILHFPRKKQIIRGVAKALICEDFFIGVEVHFFDRGILKKKQVSVSTLLLTHVMWLEENIVSEDEDENDNVPILKETLPFFSVNAIEIPKNISKALKRLQNEILSVMENLFPDSIN